MSALLELAERCEQATADEARQLLIDARELVFPHPLNGGPSTPESVVRRATFDAYVNCMKPALLDAAMTLVPEGMAWVMGVDVTGKHFANVDFAARREGATPALALCAAALRARAILEGEGNGS